MYIRRRYYGAGPGILIIVSVILVALIAGFFSSGIDRLAMDIAQNKGQNMAQMNINTAAYDYMAVSPDAKNIINMTTDADGRITSLSSDITKLNNIKSALALKIHDELVKDKRPVIHVPVANVLGITFLSGIGPNMPVTILPLSEVRIDFEDQFTQAGINQTKFTVFLRINVDINVIVSNSSRRVQVETSMPLVQTVLVGGVPQQYTNIEGVTQSSADIALEMIR